MSEGSVYQRKDGRWVAKWKDANGKWCYLYCKTKAEAKKALRQALKDRDDNIVPVGKLTLNDLLNSWLENMEGTVSRRTLENRQCAIPLPLFLILLLKGTRNPFPTTTGFFVEGMPSKVY